MKRIVVATLTVTRIYQLDSETYANDLVHSALSTEELIEHMVECEKDIIYESPLDFVDALVAIDTKEKIQVAVSVLDITDVIPDA